MEWLLALLISINYKDIMEVQMVLLPMKSFSQIEHALKILFI